MWYYVENGQQRGPITEADLQSLLQSGTINAETLVWREGMASWVSYREATGGASPGGSGIAGSSVGEVVCSECGNIFPATEVIRYGSAAVCANCKPRFVQKLKEGATIGVRMEYAGFWIRFAAYILDSIITGIAGFIVGAVIGGVIGAASAAGGQRGLAPGALIGIQLAATGAGILIRLAYFTFFVGKFGATPGKMLCKIKVVNEDGSKVSYAKALGRFFGYIVSSLICAIGYLMAAWDDEKRALHDRMCGTRVIKTDA